MAYLQILIQRRNLRNERLFKDRSNPLINFNDEEFRQRYRLTKASVMHVSNLMRARLEPQTKRNCSLGTELQILVF